MEFSSSARSITQPVASLALWALINLADPSASIAQLPNLPNSTVEQTPDAATPIQTEQQLTPYYQGDRSAPSFVPNLDTSVDNSGAWTPLPNYKLGGGDRIFIEILDVPSLSGDYQIPPDGWLDLPLIDRLYIGGLTIEEATDAIKSKYLTVLKDPHVNIRLMSLRAINVWIAGEVNRPGSYSMNLPLGSGNPAGFQSPTAVNAIEMAEGVTLMADLRRILIRRPSQSRQVQEININLWEMLQTGIVSQDITLRDGDSIFIPTTTNVNLSEVRQLATTTFTTSPDRPRNVTVVGEVNRPGSYVVLGGDTTNLARTQGLPTVTRSIQLAGGITPLADLRRIQIRRSTKTAAAQVFEVNLWQLLQAGDLNQDAILQDGDTIIVPTTNEINRAEATALAHTSLSPENIQVTVVGDVENPGVKQVSPGSPLNQALLIAGGFNEQAVRDAVDLIRLNPNGSVSRRQVTVDLSQGINDFTNPMLQNNDIILVSRSGVARFQDKVEIGVVPVGKIRPVVQLTLDTLQLLNILGIIDLD